MLRNRFREVLMVVMLLFPVLLSGGEPESEDRKSIGLALGSGGAGGLAHIAVLEVFDELGRKPDLIVGTSIGAVIGALYASGLSAEDIYDIFDDFAGSGLDALSGLVGSGSELDLGDVIKLGFKDGGVFDSSGFLEFLAGEMPVKTFDALRIPLLIVATDYWSGDTVLLGEGELIPAMKASMAVPGLFSPVRDDDRLLIDGGTSNPLPFDVARARTDLVIAVDVTGTRSRTGDNEASWVDLLFKTFEIMQQSIIAARMEAGEPDIYIKPEISGVRLLDFYRIDDILEQSRTAADTLRERLGE
ncbi:MAG: patatin-like phospholipase family protein [Ectothiorhodospiraceae bacterium]|nr:patatin-like phospholipase family protein [Ectothiorhodospiraceae bacterium]